MLRFLVLVTVLLAASLPAAAQFSPRQQRQLDDFDRDRRQDDQRWREQDRAYEQRQRARQEQEFRERANQLELERRALQNERLERSLDQPVIVQPYPVAPGAVPVYPQPAYPVQPACRALVPVYDQYGRFLGNNCVR
jgi:FMN phosphatase YigB (HAD superfamily)